jgi:hypothetical protein
VIAGWVLFLWLPAALGVTGAPTVLAALSIAAWLLVLLTAAEALRGRQERAAEARRARQEEARRKADEERLRIARELHDVFPGSAAARHTNVSNSWCEQGFMPVGRVGVVCLQSEAGRGGRATASRWRWWLG